MEQVINLPSLFVIIGLTIILLCVLLLPFFVKVIEHNLEAFLFVMGIIAVTISNLWSFEVIKTAIISPVHPKHPIVEVVFLAGIIFIYFSDKIESVTNKIEKKLGLKLFVFCVIFLLGLFSSVITAIIASLVLVEIISVLKFDKETETNIVIFSCFSIGLGAVLTPVGEPLSTIAVSRLKGEPYFADFFFLLRIMALLIVPGILLCSVAGAYYIKKEIVSKDTLKEKKRETYKDVIIRSAKVYLFIMALELLAKGFSPVVDYLMPKVKPQILYWINMISAILDNATLTAAEITPKMELLQIKAMLMGLLISGGMLIPGNIPNIISASKLKIGSKDWARLGVPFGFFLLIIYYVVLFIIIRK
jgi:predicted cation transporter